MQCNFCNRKYDCVSEGHPGVTSAVLTPGQALEYLACSLERRPEIAVVGLAGPGDPFANPDATMRTLRLVRQRCPDILLCVATNGLAIGPYIEELAELEVSHVTITVNAVDPEVGAKIYAWMRDGKRPVRGESAASLLWERQREAIRLLKSHDITVKVNSIIIPGINEAHIPEVASTVGKLGADILNCMPMVPVEGASFGNLAEPDADLVKSIRSQCSEHIAQMRHCARCRADAVGLVSESKTEPFYSLKHWTDTKRDARPFVAVASREGALVNRHLGEAEKLMIYQKRSGREKGFALKEFRHTPPKGGGDQRWADLAESLSDCRALLVVSAGNRPRTVLQERGLRIVEMEGLIEEGLKAVYSDQPVPAAMRRRFMGCSKGFSCSGTGTGCG